MSISVKRIGLIILATLAAAFGWSAPASAQATRTWVSGLGDDVNPCSRTAPCKTFAGAISKTAAGGEINCLDPAGYGSVNITKSLTIDCTGTFGSALNSGGINGVVINDSLSATPGASDVVLRGLAINGAGSTPGLNGVRFVSGRSLVVQDVFISNQKGGSGIAFLPTVAGKLHVQGVTIVNSGAGILVAPTGSGSASAVVVSSTVSNNANTGVEARGQRAAVSVSASTIANNGAAVAASDGAALTSYGNNVLTGNARDSKFTQIVRPDAE